MKKYKKVIATILSSTRSREKAEAVAAEFGIPICRRKKFGKYI